MQTPSTNFNTLSVSAQWPNTSHTPYVPHPAPAQYPQSTPPHIPPPSTAAPTQPSAAVYTPPATHGAPPPYHWNSCWSPYRYEIVILPQNAKKCYGCNYEFSEKYRRSPHNLVIKHMDRRIRGKGPTGTILYSSDFTNTYYHPNLAHIQRKNAMFYERHPVYISSNLYYSLDPIQHQILRSFQLNILLTC